MAPRRYSVEVTHFKRFTLLLLLGLAAFTLSSCVGVPPLLISINASPTTGDTPLVVSFTAVVSSGLGPFAFEWDFNNDGTTDATGQTTSAIFKRSGDFTVTLKVTDSFGQTAIATVVISPKAVGPKIVVGEAVDPPDVLLSSGIIKISVENMPNGLQGMEVSAVANKFFTYDPAVLKVTGISAVTPFGLDSFKIDNTAGKVGFIARAPAGGPFPVSAEIVRISVESVGASGASSALGLGVRNLADGNNMPITGFSIIPGMARVR